ncbi:MAG: xylulokinase [Lachnospiraceae bacterium]|jgi:xylulokinase|nr:xylulokinase [Lachnospiraceae bacterium]
MAGYILAHDLGTSGNKAALYSIDGSLKGAVVASYPTYYPFNGAVEHNPDDWWRAVCDSTKQLLAQTKVAPADIAAVSFSGIMMGCLVVDDEGVPLRNMLIWADTRSSEQEKFMLSQVDLEKGYRITGHRPSASYAAAKLLWIKDNEPEIYKKAYKMIHAKDYLVFKFTGNIVTDFSDASGTNLLDLEKKDWSDELIKAWDIRADLLPEIHASADIVGKITKEAAKETGLLEGTPVAAGGGDGSCAAVGAGVVDVGNTYNVIGSSSWISMCSKKPVIDEKMRTFTWIHLDKELYTPCGTMQAAGYSYSWYRDVLCENAIREAKEKGVGVYKLLDSHLKESKPGAGGLLYLPYLLGERSPHWNHRARGAFIGMGISTTRADFTRAVLEGVGFNLKIILDALQQENSVEKLIMIGGGAKGMDWLQILSDIFGKPLEVPRYLEEATSMGAAVSGGIAVGAYKDYTVARQYNIIEKELTPNQDNAQIYAKAYEDFKFAYEQLVPVYDKLAERGI